MWNSLKGAFWGHQKNLYVKKNEKYAKKMKTEKNRHGKKGLSAKDQRKRSQMAS